MASCRKCGSPIGSGRLCKPCQQDDSWPEDVRTDGGATYHVVCHGCPFERVEDDVATADKKRELHEATDHDVEMERVE